MDYRHLKSIISIFFIILCGMQALALNGSWRGELKVGQKQLPLVFNFSQDSVGAVMCTLDSPSQGVRGLKTTVVLCSDDSISVKCLSIGASFSGRIEPDAIKGKFSQRGFTFPLILEPEKPITERRPQTPKPPYPYLVADTTFTADDGAVMSATISMPSTGHDVPMVLMVTGSGPQNRDEEILEHKTFAVIADYLARNGIASLRYDDRGVGKSGGDFSKATTYTFKDDAASGLDFIKSLPNVGKVGVLGHSEGGTIAFMLAAEGRADFIVSLAGMALSGKETFMAQNSHALDLSGVGDKEKKADLRLIGRIFDTMIDQYQKGVSGPLDIDSIAKSSGIVVNPMLKISLKNSQKVRTKWFDAFVALDPAPYLKKIKCPTLAINGTKDTQVDASSNLKAIKKYVKNADIRLMPGLNHPLQHAHTGEVSEYGEITETISPEVLEIITHFINSIK